MHLKTLLFITLIVCCPLLNYAQYVNGNTVNYGNEWIDYSKAYFKIKINEDGIYRLDRAYLESAGFPVDNIEMSQFSMFRNGEEIHIHTSTDGIMSSSDYIEFYGFKNRNELDQFAFPDKNNQLNPEFSLVTDEAAYFLSYDTGAQLRYAASVTDVSGNLPPVEKFYMHYEKNIIANQNGFSKSSANAVRYSSTSIGEGFGFGLTNSVNQTVNTSDIYDNGPDAQIKVRFSTNLPQHDIRIKLGNNVIRNYNFAGYDVIAENIDINNALLSNSNTFNIKGYASSSDLINVSELSIIYPRSFNFNNANRASFSFEANPFSRYFELENFNISAGAPIVYDLATKRRITTVIENDIVKFISPNAAINNDFEIFTENTVDTPLSIEAVDFSDLSALNHDYLIISSEALFDYPGTSENWVQKYADYRQSPAGGSFNPLVVDIQDVYDQFGYGVDRHYLGLKAFLNFVEKEWESLEYVFIIGKGREYAFYRFESQFEEDPAFHVPTFGYPGSDNLLISDWGKTTPKVPIGRLAARSPEQIKSYYDKVVAHENQINNPQTIDDKLWMKKILHLSGGDPEIKETLKVFLKGMEDILEANEFGADVTTYFKQSSDPVELPQSDEILQLINSGISMITFFGHSAVGVFDLNLEDVEEYSNVNRYPLIISLGCHSGNVHTASENGLSERFVMADQKGAIAFLAASSQAFIGQQNEFGKNFYDKLGSDFYDQSIGKTIQQAYAEAENFTSSGWETLLEQITLHGDPALKVHASEGEDYTPDFASITLNPSVVNAFEEDFEVCFDIVNLGASAPKDMSVNIQHISPSGESLIDSSFIVTAPSFRENYCIRLPILSQNIIGKNLLKIKVDDKELIPEWPNPSAELNNSLLNTNNEDTYEFFILNNGAVPVSPKEFAIYNTADVKLLASTFNGLGDAQSYIFQLDTTNSFDSDVFFEEKLENSSSLITWEPDYNFIPGVVYYWRISPEADATGPGLVWNEASFLYLPNANAGWNQSHLNQYQKNDFDNLEIGENSDLDYVANFRDIRVYNTVSSGGDDANFFFNGTFFGFCYWRDWGEYIAVTPLDSLGNWYRNEPNHPSGAILPPPGADLSFTFYFDPQDQQSRIDFVNFIADTLQEGDYVYVYTIMPKNNFNPNFATSEWAADSIINDNKNIFNVLESQGANKISEFRNESIVPYNFFYRKNKGSLAEGKADNIEGSADNTAAVFGRWFTGTETTKKIGPSSKWTKLVWDDELSDVPENDSSYVNIIGITQDGFEEVLRTRLMEKEINLAQIDAETYPYLKLQYFTFDNRERTSADLKYWRVFYNGVSELALDFMADGIFNADTLDQGDPFILQLPLSNIGASDVDSIQVRISVVDQDNNTVINLQKTAPIEAGENSMISLEIPTDDLSGVYTVNIEANFDRTPEECFYFNNIALRQFAVAKDLRNPLLDVSFDGRRILNGDIVSSEPLISIITKDENKFLLMNDSSLYQISVIDPDGIETLITLDDPNVLFIPAADLENNQSQIDYTPSFEKDGIYTLNVRSSDASGNISGNKDFSVEFEIINDELISNVFNYPNPFSDCTQFIFTLTGNELPHELGIRIMTVSGKVVKEINGTELGPLHIGVNQTEYKWDGTDEFGNKLANGVYLYQVISKKTDGTVYEKYDTNSDQFFKNNIGKLVIIR